MSQNTTDRVRWTTTDIELLVNNDGTRYEIVDGELFVTSSPHWMHQETCGNIYSKLQNWSRAKGVLYDLRSSALLTWPTSAVP